MNVLAQTLVLPSNDQRRLRSASRSPLFLTTTPIAVSNKIKAIQARKTRLALVSTDAIHTDIRPLNFGPNGGVTSSRTEFAVLTAERLVDRSKHLRLDRISPRQTSRPSVIVNTNNNQQSLLWSTYPPSTRRNKQCQTQSNSTTITPPALESTRIKSPNRRMPDIARRQYRQALFEQYDCVVPIEIKEETISKPQPSQNIRIQSHDRTIQPNNLLQTSESENVEDNIQMNKEFEEYLEKAIIKCADWLIKYVFI